MSWTVHLEGGPRRVNHAAVAVGDKIYSFGGYCTGEDYRNRRPMDIHVLNTENYCWTKLPTPCDAFSPQYSLIPYQRYGHTAVAHNELVYIWGGRNDEASCNILFCFNTTTQQWSKPRVSGNIPAARDGHSACIINDCMYIFGGYEEDMDQFSQEVYVLSLKTLVWRYEHTKGAPPSYRDFHSATAIGDCMYIFGGRGDRHGPYHSQEEEYCNKIIYLDTKTSTWHQPTVTGFVPRGRRSHSAFCFKGDLYFFGGFNGIYNHHFDDLLKFNPRSCEWTVVKPKGKGPCARRRQSCCVVGSRVFLFGGTSPHTNRAVQLTEYHLQQYHFPPQEARLMDHNDLYVLDFAPTLRTLCILVVVQRKLDMDQLPATIRWDIRAMTTPKNILKPLDNAG